MSARHRIAVLGTGFTQTGTATPPAQIAAVAGPDFAPELVETRYSVFPGTPYDRGLAVVGYVDAGVSAAQAGHAAVFINTFGDYGLAELRSALSIPVVGAGEAAMALASTLGRKFAIVTIWPESLKFIFDERLASSGTQDRCTEIVFVLAKDEMRTRGAADDPVSRMRQGNTAVIDRVVAGAEEAIKRGADTIVLGCTCMSPIAAQIASRIAAPVIDPMTAGYKMTESLVSLRLAQSPVAYPRVTADRLAAVGNLVSGGLTASTPATDACEVCVVAAE